MDFTKDFKVYVFRVVRGPENSVCGGGNARLNLFLEPAI